MQQPSKLQAASNTFYWNVQCPFFIILRYTNVAIVCTCSLIAPCKIWQQYVHTSWYTWVRLAVLPSLDGVAQPLPGASLAVAPWWLVRATRVMQFANYKYKAAAQNQQDTCANWQRDRAVHAAFSLTACAVQLKGPIGRNGNRRLMWQPGLYMECQIPQIDIQPVLQVSHCILDRHVCIGHCRESSAVAFLLLLYFVHAIC